MAGRRPAWVRPGIGITLSCGKKVARNACCAAFWRTHTGSPVASKDAMLVISWLGTCVFARMAAEGVGAGPAVSEQPTEKETSL